MRAVTHEGVNTDDEKYFKTFKQTLYAGHKKVPTALTWNPTGDKLVVAENSVKIWAFDTIYGAQKISQSKLHDNSVETVKFGTVNLLGSISRESLRFWDVRQSPLKPFKTEKRVKIDFSTFCWNVTCNNIQTASQENLIYCVLTKDYTLNWYDFRDNSKTLQSINFKNLNSMQVNKIGWDQTNSLFICAGGENSSGSLVLLDGKTYKQIPDGVYECHCARINDFALNPSNSKIATSSEDSLVQIHNFPEFICERSYSNKNDSSTRQLSFSHDGKYLAVGSDGRSIEIYNAKYGGLAHVIKTEAERQALAWHPKRPVLCYIDEKRRILNRTQKLQDCFINILEPSF